MPNRREWLTLAGVGLAAATAGALLWPRLRPEASAIRMLMNNNFSDLAGNVRQIREWRGAVLVCNFWATWCAPCREEMPLFAEMQRKYAGNSVQFVGIGIDQVVKMREFSNSLQIPYPLLVAGAETLDLMRKLGNSSGGLPFTVVLDREGGLAARHLGALQRPELEPLLVRLASA
jgi:thiol-disulfide isomerase/thioredoxin